MAMGDMGDDFRALRERHRERRERNLQQADPTGWTKHTEHHWSRELNGHRLDYWPSRRRFRYQGRTHTGDVDGFIRKRTPAA